MGRHKTKKNNTKKKIYVFALFLLFFGGLVTLFILNPHPGYKRLEKELDAIKLPDGWIEVGPRGGEKDYWNIFCRDVTIDCPSVSTILRVENSTGLLEKFSEKLEFNGYSAKLSEKKCMSDPTQECRVTLISSDNEVTLTTKTLSKKVIYPRMYVNEIR